MKNIALIVSFSLIFFIAACSDGPSRDGGDQLPQPVQNSGSNTEGERAVEAIKDSAKSDSRSDSLNSNSRP